MAKVKRIYEIAKELGIASKTIIEKCRAEEVPGIEDHMSPVKVDLEGVIKTWFTGNADDPTTTTSTPTQSRDSAAAQDTRPIIELTTSNSPNEHQPHNLRWNTFDPSLLTSAALKEHYLDIPDSKLTDIATCLFQGRHIILAGPPGCGKTELAKSMATLLFHDQDTPFTLATANSSWTVYDVLGGLRLHHGATVFTPGVFTRAVVQAMNTDGRHWLILDEINRADIDRALGPIFTALQDGVLRLPEDIDGSREMIIPPSFRVIGTMNTVDKNTLFPMSGALLRRFAIIMLEPTPTDESSIVLTHLRAFIERVFPSESQPHAQMIAESNELQDFIATIISLVRSLRRAARQEDNWEVPQLQIGTATVIEMAKFGLTAKLLAPSLFIDRRILDKAFEINLLPQLETLDSADLDVVLTLLKADAALVSCITIIQSWQARNSVRL